MKKPKMSLGEGGAKGFAIRHVEKFVLVVCVLLVLFFFYSGWSIESLPDSKTPPKLDAAVKNAKNVIVESDPAEVIGDRKPQSNYLVRLEDSLKPTSTARYDIRPVSPRKFPATTKRADPELLPPVKFESVAVTGPLPLRPYKGAPPDLLAELPDSKPKEAPKPRARKQRNQQTDMYDTGAGGSSRRGRRRGGQSADYAMDMDAMSLESDSSMMPEMSSGMMGGGMGGSSSSKEWPGYKPGRAGAMTGSMDSEMPGASSATNASALLPRSFHMVVVNMLAPMKDQQALYDEAFSNSAGYLPQRDRPRYVWMEVERADVTSDPSAEVDESAWKPVRDVANVYQWLQVFAGIPREVADPRYLNQAITLPAPPLMMREIDKMLLHSEVPRASRAAQIAAERRSQRPERELPENQEPAADGETAPARPAGPAGIPPRPGMGAPGMGYPGATGGYPGMGGYSGMGGSYSGMSGGYPGMTGGYSQDSYDQANQYDEMAAGETYDDYGSQYGSQYGGMSGYGQPVEVMDYQMVRFFDFDVRPGRKYRYRVRLWVEDPNNPQMVQGTPRRQDLLPEVLDRLQVVKKEDEAVNDKLEKDQPPMRTYWRKTPWSDPGEIVSVPLPGRQFAGSMKKRAPRAIGDGGLEDRPPSGKIMVVEWDSKYAADVPYEQEVSPGSVLNFTEKVDLLHPITLRWKEIENYNVNSDAIVLDMRGGNFTLDYAEDPEEIKPVPVFEPAEFAILNAAGEFVVRNELDDADSFELFEPNPPPATSSSYMDMDYGGGSDADAYMEEMGGYGGRRRGR